MATMRTYGDGCGIAHALDLVGERWALLVVRELLLGPKRFTDLRGGLPSASPNVLSQRLRELEGAAIVRRRRLPPPAGSWVYELTDWGRELKPIVLSLGTWAVRSPSFPEGAPVGTDSVILALGTFFDAGAADGLSARYELRLDDSTFHVIVDDGAIELDRGPAEDPDAIVDSDATTFSAVVWNGRDLNEAIRAGELRLEGDRRAVDRLIGLFPKPEPAERAAPAGRAA
jgi:DNA-binding HxlR family transcriptional regulator/putative sterol carrier protein